MSSAPLFSDRSHAGEQLAQSIFRQLSELQAAGISAPPSIYALPRGGIPVATPVARLLNCPLDILVAKKITRPQNPELAIGAVTADGHVLWSEPKQSRKQQESLREEALRQAQAKALGQLSQLASSCPQFKPEGTIAILIDDGIATGMTIAVAAQALRSYHPAQVWICAPVAPEGLMPWLQQWGDRVIVLDTPHQFMSVSRFYTEFPQVEMATAIADLQQHNLKLLSQQEIPEIKI
jgi:putative phosphoribosyl transferase